jgi:hypothetical protein
LVDEFLPTLAVNPHYIWKKLKMEVECLNSFLFFGEECLHDAKIYIRYIGKPFGNESCIGHRNENEIHEKPLFSVYYCLLTAFFPS